MKNRRQTWVNYNDGDTDTYEGTMPQREVKPMLDDPDVACVEYVLGERVTRKFTKDDFNQKVLSKET